jgi:TetR/AcrR family transcriptional repressor of nem operon
MVNETSDRPRLTPKGARTRARIVEEAAALIHERGVAGTTLEDVKVAAEVSGSQMYHYFPDKDELVQAVIDYQADTIVTHQGRVLSSANGVEAWRNMVITAAKLTKAKGGCPLGSLGGQLAESDPEARALIAAGFDQWAAVIGDALRSLHADAKLPPDIDPDDLATTLLATLQGGLLLAQVHRSARPFETAVDTLLALAITLPDQARPGRSAAHPARRPRRLGGRTRHARPGRRDEHGPAHLVQPAHASPDTALASAGPQTPGRRAGRPCWPQQPTA